MSYEFFKEIFENDFERLDKSRKKPFGFYIYAIDGDQFDVPASKDIISSGYRGWKTKRKTETHYPKMYTTQAVDIANGLVKEFSWSHQQSEVVHARDLIRKLEKKSITIYDRLHGSYDTALVHFECENYFIVRIKTTGRALRNQFKEFLQSDKRSKKIELKPWIKKHRPGLPVRLIKIKNPNSLEDIVLMTNLKKEDFSDRQIGQLYQRRWEVEGSFRALTSILKLEQWHSKKVNGILQEVFALLWLNNIARMNCRADYKRSSSSWLESCYTKSNFKLCVKLIIENINLLLERKFKKFDEVLTFWLKRTAEKRKHLSRSYPRAIKKRGCDYDWANLVPSRG